MGRFLMALGSDRPGRCLTTAGTTPEIFNSDQGCQYTSAEWGKRLTDLGIRISMDGKGRWRDNVVVERFWWSLKHEDVYLRDYETIPAQRAGSRRNGTKISHVHAALGGL